MTSRSLPGLRAKRGVHPPGLTDRVREDVYNHVFTNDGGEVGGVLVGHSQEGGMAVVTGSIPALEAEGARASVTFTHDAWTKVHSTLERDHPGEEIVGWYHSHPGFGIFLSNHDMFIHQNFFAGASQVAYVVDPHAGTEGLFGWREGKVVLLYEAKTERAGTRRQHLPPPADARAGVTPRRYPVNAFVTALLIGVLVGVAGWFAVKDDGAAQPARGARPRHTATPAPTGNGTPAHRPAGPQPGAPQK